MSLRETITKELVRVLKEIEDPRIALVTREPFAVDKLAITQFPAILVQGSTENRETVTMGSPGAGRRTGTIQFNVRAFVRGVELDRRRNELIEAVEEQLEKDRYLGLRAEGVTDTQVRVVAVQDRLEPLAEILITLEVRYNYVRGTT
jgi:hypothetical protein